MPQTGVESAVEVAERLRSSLAYTSVKTADGIEVRFTVSIGVSQLDTREPTIDTLLQRCDKALYQAKSEGRNCVRWAAAAPENAPIRSS